MKNRIRHRLDAAKRSLHRRLERTRHQRDTGRPVLRDTVIHYEWSERTRAIAHGGVVAMKRTAQRSGLVEAIDKQLRVLSYHRPYHESDHVLVHAFNIACGGTAIEHIEALRNDEVMLDALGAEALPDPTTAGDFCRRFEPDDIDALKQAIEVARLCVWKQQPAAFFAKARLDIDGTIVETTGECKQGMGRSYKGLWGYYPHLVTLANTAEPLALINQSGNDNSVVAIGDALEDAAAFCKRAGFAEVLMRGDTAFTMTPRLDRITAAGHHFIFGYKALDALSDKARAQAESEYETLVRRAKRALKSGKQRARQPAVKRSIVKVRGYKQLVLESEELTEFEYRPKACTRDYRIVALRKHIRIERGDEVEGEETRFFFFITNDARLSAEQVVFESNDRCDQENIIRHLKAMRVLHAPVNTLVANWAYMLMASLAWTLKAWMALLLPKARRWSERHEAQRRHWLTMDFATFRKAVLEVPAQVVHHGRQLRLRFLAWRPQLPVLFRLLDAL